MKWFSKQPSEEPSKSILSIIDEDKPLPKRYKTLINHIQQITKASSEKFIPRLQDFYKDYTDIISKLCILHLTQADSKLKMKSWGEACDDLNILIDLTRYGYMKKIEEIQEIAKACLQDNNRFELKELGLALILNLLSQNPMLHIPFDIVQAAIDLSHFSANRALQLPDRHILSMKDPFWLGTLNEYLNRVTPTVHQKLTKISMYMPNQEIAKEMILMFKLLLEFTLQGGIIGSGINLVEHFKKWLGILKKTYLVALYPDLADENFRLGFPQCPEILHHFVITWIHKFITINEIFFEVFSNELSRRYIFKIIEKSFIWLNADNSLAKKTASVCLKIFSNWLDKPQALKDINNENFSLMIIEHTALIFNYRNDASKNRVEICIEAILLLEKHQELTKSKTKILKTLLNICEILISQEKICNIIEKFSFFLLQVLCSTFETSSKDFPTFAKFLHEWGGRYVPIIQEWKKKTLEISARYSVSDFADQGKISNWLEIFKIFGNPLDLSQESQSEWAISLHEIICNLLENNISQVLIIRYFLQDLSKLILGGNEITQKICLNSACFLFTKGSLQSPSLLHVQHLFYLLSVTIQREHMEITVLKHCTRLLDYNGMHVLIKPLIKIANKNRSHGLLAIFRIFSLPNYYKTTELLSLDNSKSDYWSLKSEIFQFFKLSVETNIAQQALDGLAVFLTEEITSGCHEYIELGLNLILAQCINTQNSNELAGIKALTVLIPILPQFHNKIIDFIVKNIFEPAKFDKEPLLANILNLTMCVFMNLKVNLSEETMKILFQRVAKFSAEKNLEPKLRVNMDIFLSFLGTFYLNFPLKGQSFEVIDSNSKNQGLGPDEECFALNGNLILTLYKDKLMVRNEFGKFVWTCHNYEIFDSKNYSEEKQSLTQLLDTSKLFLISESTPPMLVNNPTLELLIEFIQNTYQGVYNSPDIPNYQEITSRINFIEELEARPFPLEKPQKKNENITDLSKIFIANFGLLDNLVKIENCEKLIRSLSILDNINPREQVKIGVLFVNSGQDDEKEILANTSCSIGFKEFLKKLGRLVELDSYKGNMGSLDPRGSCGKVSVAYSDWEYDVMFHVPVLMPTDLQNDQQILKKKHVGNDNVLIVWSENWKDYRQDTLVTHFNFVNIVIYPLEKLMFRIQIFNKAGVEFGPLKDGMVVSWKTLPYLVRTTAINANKEVRFHRLPNYDKSTIIRHKSIRDIINDSLIGKDSAAFHTSRF